MIPNDAKRDIGLLLSGRRLSRFWQGTFVTLSADLSELLEERRKDVRVVVRNPLREIG